MDSKFALTSSSQSTKPGSVHTDSIFHFINFFIAHFSYVVQWAKLKKSSCERDYTLKYFVVIKKFCRAQSSLKKLSLLTAYIIVIAGYIPRNSHWVLLLTMQLLAESHTMKQWVESLLRLKWETSMVLRKTWVFNSKMYSKQLLDEVFCDIQNNQGLSKSYQPKPKAQEADNHY